MIFIVFFFQAEDGIRDYKVTGVQTCALPISLERNGITLRTLDMKHFADEVELIKQLYNSAWEKNWGFVPLTNAEIDHLAKRSEERRVGKECRSRWSPYH